MNIEILRKRKKELGMTLDEISEKSGISRRTVARIFSRTESDKVPTVSTVEAIERALGLRDGGLQETAREEISPQEYRLLSAFRSVDTVTRELVIALLENVGRR